MRIVSRCQGTIFLFNDAISISRRIYGGSLLKPLFVPHVGWMSFYWGKIVISFWNWKNNPKEV
jgi:hypothetical protein